MHAQPGHPVHGSVSLAARGVGHRRHSQASDRPGHGLARPGLRPDPGRLVPGRRLPHPLPREVAHLPCRPPDARDPRRAHGLRRRGSPAPRRRRRLPTGRPARPLRLLGLDRARAARRGQVGLRHGARRRLRRAGGRAVRRAGRRPGRRSVADRGVVRQPPRHHLLGLRVGTAAAVRSPRRLRPRRARGALAVRLLRRPATVPGRLPGCVGRDDLPHRHRPRLPAPLLPPAPAGRRGDRAGSWVPSIGAAWPTTPSWC